MGYRMCIRLDGWETLSVSQGADALEAMVTALAIVDTAWRQANPSAPDLYQSGVRYRPDLESVEMQWLDTPALYDAGYGDCKALAAALLGEYWARGIAAEPLITTDSKNEAYHVQVKTPWGIEDPSLRLGMGEYE